MNSKETLRDEATRAITALSPEQRIVLDAQIATHVTHMPFWSQAEVVLGYVALDDEVDLQAVFRAASRAGKRIALPRIAARNAPMEFRIVDDYPSSLERHAYGFLQPPENAELFSPEDTALVLVPGRMFDRSGFRVGRGGGYYDHFLPTLPATAVTVGVGYAIQLVQSVPHGEGDVPVQIVVTDAESCFCRRPQP